MPQVIPNFMGVEFDINSTPELNKINTKINEQDLK